MQLLVIARAEEGKRSNQRADAHPGHHGEFRPRAGFAPAGEHARAVGAVGAAAGDRQPRPVHRRQEPSKLAVGIAPHARVGDAGNERGIFVLRREGRPLFLALCRAFGRGGFSLGLLLGGVRLRLCLRPLELWARQ